MSDGFTASADRLEDVIVQFEQLGDGAHARLNAAVVAELADFVSIVKNDKLSGQVLRKQSGQLFDSVDGREEDDAGGVTGVVSADTPYARAQEFGAIIEPVNALALKFQIDGHWVQVMRVVLPERSYLRSTLAERADEIRARFLAAVMGTAP